MPDDLNPSLERDRQLFYELEEIERTLLRRKTQSGISYYIPNKKQLQFHNSHAKYPMFLGANRTGKTHSLVAEFVMHSTGIYPAWYPEDKKMSNPVKLLFIALSFEEHY